MIKELDETKQNLLIAIETLAAENQFLRNELNEIDNLGQKSPFSRDPYLNKS